MDRSVRFLQALGRASTSRVLNLGHIARTNRENAEHAQKPLFRSPIVNTAFILKHRTRSDEDYMFSPPRAVATKILMPFDLDDMRAGGRSLFIDQRGFLDSLREAGRYQGDENLEHDLAVLRLMNALPSLDPFLLREHLRNHHIDVAPCYFAISEGDQARMHAFVAAELSRLIVMASGGQESGIGIERMVSAMLSSEVDEKLEPLRQTLGLTGGDFREGVFGWRGFLYYKWSIENFWPEVMDALREIKAIQPHGAITLEQRAYLTGAKTSILEQVRDSGAQIRKVLQIYDESFAALVAEQAPKTFRDFLLSAPHLFLDLGEKMGAISHIASFWRYRFPADHPAQIDVDELTAIFQDFISGFTEKTRDGAGRAQKPLVFET